MKRSKFLKSTILIYSILGFIFGLLFPIGAILFEAISHHEPITTIFIIKCHLEHPILVLIETAPVFMGIAGGIIGAQKEKLDTWATNLEKRVEVSNYEANTQKEFYKGLVQNAPLGIVALNNEHLITAVNKSFEKMFGFYESDIIGQNLDDLVASDSLYQKAEIITSRIKRGETIQETGKRKRKDGQLIDVKISGVPILHLGEQIGILGIYEEITERMRLENAMRLSEIKFRAVAETANDAIITINSQGTITFWNKAAEKIFGYSEKEIINQKIAQIIPKKYHGDKKSSLNRFLYKQLRNILNKSVELSGLRKDGTEIPIQISASSWKTDEETFFTAIIRDITEQKKIEQAIKNSEANFKSLFDNSPISLWEEDFSEIKKYIDNLKKSGIDDLSKYLFEHPEVVKELASKVKILQVNFATIKLYRAKDKEELLAGLVNIFSPESLIAFRDEIISLSAGNTRFQNEVMQKNLLGEDIYAHILVSIAPGYEDTWEKVFVSITDITERKEIEEKYKHMSFHDSLTGLYNRAYFETEMTRLEKSRRFPISIVVFDMNNLKHINDTMGHAAGDQAIISVASLLSKIFRDEDMVARIGGDEFAVILPGTEDQTMAMIKERIENSILHTNLENSANERFHPISISMGIATIQKEQNLMEGYKLADKRMYEDKRKQQDKVKGHNKHS